MPRRPFVPLRSKTQTGAVGSPGMQSRAEARKGKCSLGFWCHSKRNEASFLCRALPGAVVNAVCFSTPGYRRHGVGLREECAPIACAVHYRDPSDALIGEFAGSRISRRHRRHIGDTVSRRVGVGLRPPPRSHHKPSMSESFR